MWLLSLGIIADHEDHDDYDKHDNHDDQDNHDDHKDHDNHNDHDDHDKHEVNKWKCKKWKWKHTIGKIEDKKVKIILWKPVMACGNVFKCDSIS